MEDFVTSYGLWILLAVVFVAMHWFGVGCGGARHHLMPPRQKQPDEPDQPKKPDAPTGRGGGRP